MRRSMRSSFARAINFPPLAALYARTVPYAQ